MQDQILHAKTIMEKGFAIIPLYKDSKANGDKEIITRDYTLAHLQKPLNNHKGEPLWHTDGNQGLNLEKSGLTVLRFSDEDILSELDKVIISVENYIDEFESKQNNTI